MTTRRIPASCRFGFLADGDQHHFQVSIPGQSNSDALVEIRECFLLPTNDRPLTSDKQAKTLASLPVSIWEDILPSFAREIKLKEKSNAKNIRFSSGLNLIPRLLGKELCLLVWAVENAHACEVSSAIERWSGLTSEERWWLFNMASSDLGTKDSGWKLAIQIALCNRSNSNVGSYELAQPYSAPTIRIQN